MVAGGAQIRDRSHMFFTLGCPACQARLARAEVEAALDTIGWPWSRRLSLWIDSLIVLEEGGA